MFIILKGSIGVVSDLFKNFFFYITIKNLLDKLKTIIITLKDANAVNEHIPFPIACIQAFVRLHELIFYSNQYFIYFHLIHALMKDTAGVRKFSVIIIVFNLSSKFLIVI